MKLDKTYEEKVYAGVLGKLIGVYLGRPFEQWSHVTTAQKDGLNTHQLIYRALQRILFLHKSYLVS